MTLNEAQSKIEAILDLLEMSEGVDVQNLTLIRVDTRSMNNPRGVRKIIQIEVEAPGEGF
jgi:hypothetical protein